MLPLRSLPRDRSRSAFWRRFDRRTPKPRSQRSLPSSPRARANSNPLKIPNSDSTAGLARDQAAGLRDLSRELPADPASGYESRADNAAETYRALHSRSAVVRSERSRSIRRGARPFFEQNFRPIRLPRRANRGFFTGYYEPVVEGARYPSDIYTTPLYRRRPTLRGDAACPTRQGQGRQADGSARAPYYDRTQIEDGALAGRDLEIAWLKDPIDAFFAQIQGSGARAPRRRQSGAANYDDKNGHPYFAVGSRPDRARHRLERRNVDAEDPRIHGEEPGRGQRSCGG